MHIVHGCPNLFGGDFGGQQKEASLPRIQDQDLLRALLQATPSQLLTVLEQQLGIKNSKEMLTHAGFGLVERGEFVFHAPHHFIDGLENPLLLTGKERDAALMIIHSLHTHEVTEVIRALQGQDGSASSSGICR